MTTFGKAALALTLAILTVIAVPAFAGKGGGTVATISFATDARVASQGRGATVAFAVDPLRVRDRDLYKLWVANWCYQDGVAVSAEFLPVQYPAARQGWSGWFTLNGQSWVDGPATCTAYVWKHPASHDPLAGASMTYSVG